ncbi:MAG: hypothetical protein WA691_08595 [Thermoplasmata archaeon]
MKSQQRRRLNQRGGVLLDGVLAIAFVLVGAFALESVGITFHVLLHGASRFFGL